VHFVRRVYCTLYIIKENQYTEYYLQQYSTRNSKFPWVSFRIINEFLPVKPGTISFITRIMICVSKYSILILVMFCFSQIRLQVLTNRNCDSYSYSISILYLRIVGTTMRVFNEFGYSSSHTEHDYSNDYDFNSTVIDGEYSSLSPNGFFPTVSSSEFLNGNSTSDTVSDSSIFLDSLNSSFERVIPTVSSISTMKPTLDSSNHSIESSMISFVNNMTSIMTPISTSTSTSTLEPIRSTLELILNPIRSTPKPIDSINSSINSINLIPKPNTLHSSSTTTIHSSKRNSTVSYSSFKRSQIRTYYNWGDHIS